MLRSKLGEESREEGELRHGDVGRDPVVIFFSYGDLCSRKFLVNTTWASGQESHFFSTSATTALVSANSIFWPEACKTPLGGCPAASLSPLKLLHHKTLRPFAPLSDLSNVSLPCLKLFDYLSLRPGVLTLPACENHLENFKRPWWPDTTSEILIWLFWKGGLRGRGGIR